MAGKGTLVQQANAVESLSNVDVLCTDKTGTLTTNAIRFHDLVIAEGRSRGEAETLLGAFAASASERNKTTEALAAAFPSQPLAVAAEAVFSSERKWSGLAFAGAEALPADDPPRGTFVLGAPEAVAPGLSTAGAETMAPGGELGGRLGEWMGQGLRVLLFAGIPESAAFSAAADDPPALPRDLAPVALVCFSDELRPHVRETLDDFAQANIAVKVISGDSPQTVAALATQAGLHGGDGDLGAISGKELAALGDDAFAAAAEADTVFARVTPDQKEQLAQALRDRGRYVAMIGDGVNDVVALKQADLGIAMNSGSQAARAVAGLILIKDSFAALPAAFREGQRIRNGLQDVLEIFMVRIFGKALVIALMLPFAGFPFAPRNSSLLSFLGAGVPAIVLTACAPARPPIKGSIFRPLARFTLPPIAIMSVMAVAIHLVVRSRAETAFAAAHAGASPAAAFDFALPVAQSATIAFLILCSLLLIPFVAPPVKWFAAGAPLRGDWRPTLAAAGLLALFAGIYLLPFSRHIFELSTLTAWEWALVSGGAVVWALVTRLVWRSGLADKLTRSR
jgi:cation-transporting P-type ATPase E